MLAQKGLYKGYIQFRGHIIRPPNNSVTSNGMKRKLELLGRDQGLRFKVQGVGVWWPDAKTRQTEKTP